ncbi:MAG: 50S ribosomal protein L24, partial [Gammaproteobacteria bacterium]|nr:50S ribosomal protein L24 [Gammaproteobacteria bacterium]
MINRKKTVRQKRLKKGDEVIVMAGKSKGKRGLIKQVKYFNDGRVKLLVEGVNLIKKHVKPNPQLNEPGGIKEREAFIDID